MDLSSPTLFVIRGMPLCILVPPSFQLNSFVLSNNAIDDCENLPSGDRGQKALEQGKHQEKRRPRPKSNIGKDLGPGGVGKLRRLFH
jgi:hypothetical protein